MQLQRRILDEFDKHCPHPLLPMRIPHLLRAAGLDCSAAPEVIAITNTEWDEAGFGKGAASNAVKYVTEQGLVDAEDTQRWITELEDSAKNGEFFFNINRYVFEGRKR